MIEPVNKPSSEIELDPSEKYVIEETALFVGCFSKGLCFKQLAPPVAPAHRATASKKRIYIAYPHTAYPGFQSAKEFLTSKNLLPFNDGFDVQWMPINLGNLSIERKSTDIRIARFNEPKQAEELLNCEEKNIILLISVPNDEPKDEQYKMNKHTGAQLEATIDLFINMIEGYFYAVRQSCIEQRIQFNFTVVIADTLQAYNDSNPENQNTLNKWVEKGKQWRDAAEKVINRLKKFGDYIKIDFKTWQQLLAEANSYDFPIMNKTLTEAYKEGKTIRVSCPEKTFFSAVHENINAYKNRQTTIRTKGNENNYNVEKQSILNPSSTNLVGFADLSNENVKVLTKDEHEKIKKCQEKIFVNMFKRDPGFANSPYNNVQKNTHLAAISDHELPKIEGLKHEKISSGGHCFYEAVMRSLPDVKKQEELRHKVADHIKYNSAKFIDFIPLQGRNLSDYLENIRNGTNFADNVEIHALMQALGRPIVVIGQDGQIQNRDEIDQFKKDPIFVYHNGRDHYDALLVDNRQQYTAKAIMFRLLQPIKQARRSAIHRMIEFPNGNDDNHIRILILLFCSYLNTDKQIPIKIIKNWLHKRTKQKDLPNFESVINMLIAPDAFIHRKEAIITITRRGVHEAQNVDQKDLQNDVIQYQAWLNDITETLTNELENTDEYAGAYTNLYTEYLPHMAALITHYKSMQQTDADFCCENYYYNKLLLFLGLGYFFGADPKNAMCCFDECVKNLEALLKKSKSEDIPCQYLLSKALLGLASVHGLNRQTIDLSITSINAALSLMRKCYMHDSNAYANALVNLGDAYIKKFTTVEDYENAQDSFAMAMSIFNGNRLASNHSHMLNLSNRLTKLNELKTSGQLAALHGQFRTQPVSPNKKPLTQHSRTGMNIK